MVRGPYVLLYDRDCGPCTAAARFLGALSYRHRLRPRPILDSRDLLSNVPEDRILDAFHMVTPDGRVVTGGDAVPILVEAFPLGAGASRVLRRSSTLMDLTRRAYDFVARFRDALTCRVSLGFSGPAVGR